MTTKTKKTDKTEKTKAEWLEWYQKHGGHEDLQLDSRENILFHPQHGFITFLTHDETFELHHLVGDGKYWQKVIVKIMKMEGLKTLHAFTKRNPKAWIRKYGGHIDGYYMEASLDEIEI